MTPSLVILWMAAAASGPIGPSPERHLFALRSRPAWERVQTRLKELGLTPDKTDRQNQVLLTRWTDIGAKGVEWLLTPEMPEPYAAEGVRYEVFVSPFAEPARVSVGSVTKATKKHSSDSTATVYNLAAVNRALMGQLAKALGGTGQAIPVDAVERRDLALSLLGDEADECLRGGPSDRSAPVTPPRKIPLSVFEFLYPAPARSEGKEGAVKVGFTILEDGGVASVHLLGPPIGHQLEASALGAASLLLYEPTRRGRCPAVAAMTYTVNYRASR
jgi:TonB family protein